MEIDKYSEIAPYNDDEIQEKVSLMVKDPGFEHAVKFIFPQINYEEFASELKKITNHYDFQVKVMIPFINTLIEKTTAGISSDGLDKVSESTTYTYITNHRDIVLDAAFLDFILHRGGKPLAEVAIGSNLLIYEWINHLVKLNQSFIVKRNLRMIEALEAAKQLSGYMHYCLNEKGKSVWIAQREGRAKDSNDVTQESLVKMISLGGGESVLDNILSARLMPVAISYEYDPNDYLKAKEFLLRKKDPEFKKSQRDDLMSMETGMLGFKGRVNFSFGQCINDELKKRVDADAERATVVKEACNLIDRYIHLGYAIYPINYIAYDKVNGTERFSDRYTADDIAQVNAYLDGQLKKVDLPELSEDDYAYMREMMLKMYANPLNNKLNAEQSE